MARNSFRLAAWAADELEALVILENPETSYVWDYEATLDEFKAPSTDATWAVCLFGGSTQRHTRLRCWNFVPSGLDTLLDYPGSLHLRRPILQPGPRGERVGGSASRP